VLSPAFTGLRESRKTTDIRLRAEKMAHLGLHKTSDKPKQLPAPAPDSLS